MLFESKVKSLLGLVENNYWNEVERIRLSNAELLYIFYRNDKEAVINELKKRMKKEGKGLFKDETIERFIAFNYKNPLPKMLNILCNVYSEEPKRKILLGEQEDKNETKKLIDFYSNSSFNAKMLEAHKLAKLFGSILVMPIIVDEKIKHKILYPFQVSVSTSDIDSQKIIELAILDWRWNERKQEYEKILHIWNEKEYYILDSDLNRINSIVIDGVKKELINPYGRIPVEVLTLFENEIDFWDESWLEVVENIIDLSVINILMSYNSHFLTGGIPVLINYELENLLENDNEIGVRLNDKIIGYEKKDNTIRLSPDSIINLRNNIPDQNVDFKYVTPQTNLTELKEFIDWKRKDLLANKGISPNAFNLERVSQSGYAKQMEELETIQLRKQDIPKLRDFENRYFELIKLMAEVNNINDYKFNPESKLIIDFPEVTYPKSSDEIAKEIDTLIKYNIKNPIDFIRDYNTNISLEEAEEIYNKNKEINAMQETKD
ncbi:MAG TPA: hypothetical protein PLU67_03415, partial [Candidatus Kapabacteria bacterium]|nr:hypothetical protein [Candidatus Kapabacteria bacterium]